MVKKIESLAWEPQHSSWARPITQQTRSRSSPKDHLKLSHAKKKDTWNGCLFLNEILCFLKSLPSCVVSTSHHEVQLGLPTFLRSEANKQTNKKHILSLFSFLFSSPPPFFMSLPFVCQLEPRYIFLILWTSLCFF